MHIFADQINKIFVTNNNLRVELIQRGADNAPMDAGTLIIPLNQAANIVNGLVNGLKELDERLKAQKNPETGNSDAAGNALDKSETKDQTLIN